MNLFDSRARMRWLRFPRFIAVRLSNCCQPRNHEVLSNGIRKGQVMSSVCTILIVDNDSGILKAWSRLLRAEGYQVETADSGEAGLTSAGNIQPDLVLTDLSMPGMGGVEFCRRLRFDPRFSGIPVILTSTEHQTFHEPPPWNETWKKPVAIETMLASISRLLRD
jgi:CheY-like chemotaxis protein